MGKKVFLSYCHKQAPWVRGRLLPVLKASGCEVFIDVERFKGGFGVVAQMDAWQDQADVSLLVMSPEYLASTNCKHEMDRAISFDPGFTRGKVLPVVRVDCNMSAFTAAASSPLWVDLKDDSEAGKWKLLLDSLEATDLRASAPHWLQVRDDIVRKVRDQAQSVNLIVKGTPNSHALCAHIKEWLLPDMGIVEFSNPATITRDGLVREILRVCGDKGEVLPPPNDLKALNRLLGSTTLVRLALLDFQIVGHRREQYTVEFFNALKYLLDKRKVVLLIESSLPFRDLVPVDNILSNLPPQVVELREH